MKIYTEEQVRKAYEDGNRDGFNHICISDDYLNFITPIELPSDEDLDKWIVNHDYEFSKVDIQTTKWVIEQIKQQDKCNM